MSAVCSAMAAHCARSRLCLWQGHPLGGRHEAEDHDADQDDRYYEVPTEWPLAPPDHLPERADDEQSKRQHQDHEGQLPASETL